MVLEGDLPLNKADAPAFDFLEKVRIGPTATGRATDVIGDTGVVLGRSLSPSGAWDLAVYIYRLGRSFMIDQSHLIRTGEFDRGFYGGEVIRVAVDPNGRGYLVDDDVPLQ